MKIACGDMTVEYGYDAAGNVTLLRIGEKETHYGYDSMGRISSESDSDGNITNYRYDLAGHLIELEENAERVGFAAFYHNDRKLRRAFLSMIVVLPEYQGRGCGSRLLAETEHECIEDGMKILAVEVRTDNRRAIKFYEERGFEVINALSDIKVILEKELK